MAARSVLKNKKNQKMREAIDDIAVQCGDTAEGEGVKVGNNQNYRVFQKKYPLLFSSFLGFQNIFKSSSVHFLTAQPLQNPKIVVYLFHE